MNADLIKKRDKLFWSLDRLDFGRFTLTTPDGHTRVFQGANDGPACRVELHDWSVIPNLAIKGDVGLGEDYRDGKWTTDHLQSFLTFGLLNQRALDRYVLGKGFFRALTSLSYLMRMNSRTGSRKNIHAHYDLGNDFYALWLDSGMTYSSALFAAPALDLRAAQDAKYDRILDRLGSDPGSVLEIGCGWGGFAERLAMRGSTPLKGITLSTEQCDYARDRLGSRAQIALEDYRVQQGQYASIVSIEMFEAVGEEYWPTYFRQIKNLLAKGGRALIQTITIRDDHFARYRKGSDFIRSYIFPGGLLPSRSRFVAEAAKAGLQIVDSFSFGRDYARTLDTWLDRFDAQKDRVDALGFDEGFRRLWRFYLAACSAGFTAGRTDVLQYELRHA